MKPGTSVLAFNIWNLPKKLSFQTFSYPRLFISFFLFIFIQLICSHHGFTNSDFWNFTIFLPIIEDGLALSFVLYPNWIQKLSQQKICIWNSSFYSFRYWFISKLFSSSHCFESFFKRKFGTFYRFKVKASKENSICVQLSTVQCGSFFYKMRSKTVTIATFTGECGFSGVQAYHVIRFNTCTPTVSLKK